MPTKLKRPLILLLVAVLLNTAACGYLIYPERQGQRGDRVDGTVVALDAVGLLFFILPGVIAFAVDFASGCIYLPKGKEGVFSLQEATPEGWVPVAKVAPFADDKTIIAALKNYLQRNASNHDVSHNDVARIEWMPARELPTLASSY